MPSQAQAIKSARLAPTRLLRCGLALPLLVLAGCGGGNMLSKVEADPTIVTNSVRGEVGFTVDRDLASDEATIRNVATGVDLEGVSQSGVPWSNTATGSRGAITGLSEYSQDGQTCRRYTVSRERYDGVNLYRGETCFDRSGIWRSRAFQSG